MIKNRSSLVRSTWVGLLLISGGLFLGRGVWRTADLELRDYASPYAGARLFWQGENPYEKKLIDQALSSAGSPDSFFTAAVYPPFSLVAISPFAIFSAPISKFVYLSTSLAILGLGIVRLMEIAELTGHQKQVSLALIIASSPLHTAMMVSNPALLSVATLFLGVSLLIKNKNLTGSILLVWSFLLKPQLGIAGILWLLITKGRRQSIPVLMTIFITIVLCFAALHYRIPSGVSHWLENIRMESTSGTIANSGSLGIQRIDPTSLGFAITGLELPIGIPLTLAVGILIPIRRLLSRQFTIRDHPTFAIALIPLLFLLVGYHRIYDALLLVPCLIFLVKSPPGTRFWSLAATACALAWTLPGGGFWLKFSGHAFDELSTIFSSPLWLNSVGRIHSWAILATALLLISKQPQQPTVERE